MSGVMDGWMARSRDVGAWGRQSVVSTESRGKDDVDSFSLAQRNRVLPV